MDNILDSLEYLGTQYENPQNIEDHKDNFSDYYSKECLRGNEPRSNIEKIFFYIEYLKSLGRIRLSSTNNEYYYFNENILKREWNKDKPFGTTNTIIDSLMTENYLSESDKKNGLHTKRDGYSLCIPIVTFFENTNK